VMAYGSACAAAGLPFQSRPHARLRLLFCMLYTRGQPVRAVPSMSCCILLPARVPQGNDDGHKKIPLVLRAPSWPVCPRGAAAAAWRQHAGVRPLQHQLAAAAPAGARCCRWACAALCVPALRAAPRATRTAAAG
jgi:hypothetical protein